MELRRTSDRVLDEKSVVKILIAEETPTRILKRGHVRNTPRGFINDRPSVRCHPTTVRPNP
jgi:hypothetical protein